MSGFFGNGNGRAGNQANNYLNSPEYAARVQSREGMMDWVNQMRANHEAEFGSDAMDRSTAGSVGLPPAFGLQTTGVGGGYDQTQFTSPETPGVQPRGGNPRWPGYDPATDPYGQPSNNTPTPAGFPGQDVLPFSWGGAGSGGGGTGSQNQGNPYLDAIAGNMGQQWTDTLMEQWLPAIRDNNINAGGYGGSGYDLAQGTAVGKAATGYAGALANLYGGAWENSQGRDLQRYGIDTSADLQNQNQWMNYDLGNQGLGLQGMGLGLQFLNAGAQGPWTGVNNMGNLLNGVGSQNGTTTSGGQQGGGWGGLLGGALTGASFGRQAGWW